ncbi:MAG: type II CRISPR RNA-guided endonuclease Cas9 [Verrucomicrobiota bacterium]
MNVKSSCSDFLNGLVFGFDVGTGSIGEAVRKGEDVKDVGVLICPEDTSDLSGRRGLRRQRRTLRSRKYRRRWFAKELENLGLPKPQSQPHDPITLRLRALNGEELKPEELHAALAHLFRRRGYSKVPWANVEKAANAATKPKKDDDEGEIIESANSIKADMEKRGCQHPCQYLAKRREEAGKSPSEKWGRKIYWLRDLLEGEFRDIVQVQAKRFAKLAEKADWLLYGESKEVKRPDGEYHVFFKTTEARNPGVLGLRWPRFDNRGPALDSFQPVDEQGRPFHVVRKNKEAFTKAQWELAVMNFRVIEIATGKTVPPDTKSMVRLREIWESKKRGKKPKSANAVPEIQPPKVLEISKSVLGKWAEEFSNQYKLVEGQQPLTPQTGAGRARYSSPTLERIVSGERFDPPQPVLRRNGENAEEALNRYLADIKHPLVRHRLVLFRRLLTELVLRFGQPDMIVLEAVRSLALSPTKKREHIQKLHNNREERTGIREELKKDGFSSSKNSILRYRLFKEAKGRCPFCLCPFCLKEVIFKEAEIEHIVPRSRVDSNEFFNLTVAHRDCNQHKGERTPWEAFGNTPEWEGIRQNAEDCFGLGSLKYRLFTNPDAENMVEQKADLQHTAYIARVIRHISPIQLDWLGEDGRDPSGLKDPQKTAWRFQVTNGQLTSRLRKAWGLNQILHPLPAGKRWDELTEPEQKQFTEKNRGDLRHHALDAMVIACTLPWLAHRTHGAKDEFGNHGWWTQDEKQRSKVANPIFPREGRMHEVVKREIERVVVQHHASRSNHQQGYNTTLYAKKDKDIYVVRKPLTSLTVKNLSSIYPNELAAYCEATWERYAEESANLDAELKKTNKHLPENFAKKLCFSHFQRWRADFAPAFRWPEKVNIPIKSVRLVAIKDDRAVVPFSKGTRAYVERTGFKEVRIHPSEDGKSFVPVFVPYWKGDSPFSSYSFAPNSKPVAVIHKGQVVELKKALAAGAPAGKYRVLVMGQEQIKILPPHVANKDEAKIAFQLPKSGLQPYWPEFIRCIGYELPHPPSAQSQSPGAVQA